MSAESEGERSEQEGGGGENGEMSALEESDSGNREFSNINVEIGILHVYMLYFWYRFLLLISEEGVDDQVMKLMQSLSVLTEEKSKMETSFQQDKKRLLVW